MKVLRLLRNNNHRDRQLTMNDLTKRERLSRYKFGRNTTTRFPGPDDC
jgi:hypothetical protein